MGAVRAYVLNDVQKQVDELWLRVEKVLNAPDA
jgi:hypothetical protein